MLQICEDYDEHVENCAGREPLTCTICQREFKYEYAFKVRTILSAKENELMA